LKIAFVSFEYPPVTGYGGIGTYVFKATRLLQARGHYIEVFAANPSHPSSDYEDGVLVHRAEATRREDFTEAIVTIFSGRQRTVQFDVIESPEYFHEASSIAAAFPEIALIVKLHSPSLLLCELQGGFGPATLRTSLRNYWPQFRRLGRSLLMRQALPKWYWRDWEYRYALERDAAERTFTANADLIVSPSQALLNMMKDRWKLDPTKCFHVPNPYDAPKALLDIPIETRWEVISFFGRLETRKGLLLLSKILPRLLKEIPGLTLRFVGRDGPGPNEGETYSNYLQRIAGPNVHRLEFTGQVSLQETYHYYSLTDICVFPSVWENFPNVCLEAMAAGRGIVGSSAGGMAEMIIDGTGGIIVDPNDSDALLQALLKLARDPAQRQQMGQAARERLLEDYASEKSVLLLEACYQRALTHRVKNVLAARQV
jgi:glycosyltransferase involved in cell wall biosynthesis